MPKKLPIISFAVFILFAFCIPSHAQIITTVAGDGAGGFSGDGGPATSASVNYEWNLATDGSGNLYIGGGWYSASQSYSRERMVTPAGIISLFTGTGTPGFSGDGGPASAAQIYYPWGTAIDAAGNIYITDAGNARIRKVNTSGIISTIAGTGTMGSSGDGGMAATAEVYNPWGIAVDPSGNIYFSDYGNWRIRKISTSGIISTIAGTGSVGYSGDGGPATAAQVNYTYGLAADGSGNVYFTDCNNNRVRMINSSGIVSTIAGNGSPGFSGDGGPSTAALIYGPVGIAIDGGGNLIFAEAYNQRIRKINSSGIISTIAGTGSTGFSGDNGPATACTFHSPFSVAVDVNNNVYIGDYINQRVRKITYHNRAPYFTKGVSQNLTVCENSVYDSTNALLTVFDSDYYQAETWALLSGPGHGSAAGSYTTVSACDTMLPHGLSYTPAPGFTGLDTFKMTVTDGYVLDTIAIYVTVIPAPGPITGIIQVCAGLTTTLSDTSTGCTWSSVGTSVATIGSSGIVTGSTAGVETISYTYTATGCAATVALTVNPLPSATYSVSPNPNCYGTPITFASGAPLCSINALSFNGTNSKAARTGVFSTVTNNMTLEAWVKWNGSSGTQTLLLNGTNGTSGYQLFISGGVIGCDVGSVATMSSSASLTSGLWEHVALVRNSGTWALYLNDVPYTLTSSTASPITPSGSFCVGSNQSATQVFDGTIDEVKFWSVVRTATQIGADMTACNTLPQTGLTGYWKFDEGVGTTTADASGNGNTLTLSNTTWVGAGEILSTYAWSFGDAATSTINSTVHIYSATGSYTSSLTVTSSYGCTATSSSTVTVNPMPSVITGPNSVCFGATITLSDSSAGGTWGIAASPGVASIGSATGIVTGGTTSGPATVIYATSSGCTVTKLITVNPTPFTIYGSSSSVCEGAETTLYDVASGGTWSSSNTGVATVGSAGAMAGVVTGIANGTALISYTYPTGCYVYYLMLVNVAPSVISGSPILCLGATTSYSDSIGGGTWTSSAYDTAYIDAGGAVTGFSAGPATISYTLADGCTSASVISINPAPAAITGSATVCAGAATYLFDAVSGGIWSSSTPGIASVSSSGAVIGISPGLDTILYSTGSGCKVIFPMTVYPVPAVITGPVSVCPGGTITLTDTTTGGSWSCPTSAGIATISSAGPPPAGTLSGVGTGLAIVSYTIGSAGTGTACSVTKAVSVNPSPATPTAIGTGTLHICPGATTTLSSSAGGTWSSAVGTPLVAVIGSTSGTVSGLVPGIAAVTYTLPTGCTSTAIVTVNPLPSIITGASSVCVGLTATLSDSVAGGIWSKSNTNINIGSGTGVVTGVAAGTTIVTYTIPATGCAATRTETVNTSPGAITGPVNVCPGATITLGNSLAGGTWTSSSTGSLPGSATIGSLSGIVTGVASGTVTITYSFGAGCSITAPITVNPLPSLVTGTMHECAEASITLSDSTAGGVWSTGSATASVGSGTGIVTGISGGPALISYTSPIGCTRTAIVTINPLPLPVGGPSAVCVGPSITLIGSGGGTWSGSNPSVATVGTLTGVVTGVATGTTTINYTLPTGCAVNTTVTVSLSPRPITGPSTVCAGVTITLTDSVGGGVWTSSAGSLSGGITVGSLSGVVTGGTAGTTATISYSLGSGCTVAKTITAIASPGAITGAGILCTGTTLSLTPPSGIGTWSSGAGVVATVTAAGVVHGVASGTAPISYTITSTGCPAVALITVSPTPGPIGGPSALCIGSSITETDSSASGTWSTASPGISIGLAGVVTGISLGPAIISYSVGSTGSLPGCITTRTVTVNTIGAITGATGLCTGASAILSDAMAGGIWSTATGGVVTVGTATGAIMAGVTTGTSVITYTLGSTGSGTGCSTTTTVTVNTGPSAISGVLLVCAGTTTILSNTSGGGTWSSSPAAIGTIDPAGLLTGIAPGTDTITYSLGTGCTVKVVVTVNASPSGITGTLQLCVGSTTNLSTTSTGGLWTSSLSSIATVTPAGVVHGISAGVAAVSYTVSGCSAVKIVTVNSAPSAITGASEVCSGLTTTLADTTSAGLWSSASTGITTVDSVTGMVTGVGVGTGTISYVLPTGCMATKLVTVNSAPLAITGLRSICLGSSTTLSDLTGGGVWSAGPGSAGIVSVGATGIITGVGLGAATVSYAAGGCPAVATVTVNSLPGAIGGSPNVCLGTTDSLTALPGGGVWSSSNALVATVGSPAGVVAGVEPGTATIDYSLGIGCTVHMTVTVHPAPPAITGPTNVCAGHTVTLSDVATGGTWVGSSGSLSIASVSLAGVVSGITGGVAVISYFAPIGSGISCPATYAVAVTQVPPIMGISNICAYGATLHVSDSAAGGAWTSALVSVTPAGVVTGYAAGAATIYYTLSDGCYTSATLTVNPLPDPITGSQKVCIASTTTLGELTTGGVWSSSDTTIATATAAMPSVVSAMAPGTATIAYTLPTGCAEAVTVTVSPIPSAISGADNVCVGSTATLSDLVTGGSWSAAGTGIVSVGSASGVVTGLSAGTANIIYTVAPLCNVSITVTVNPLPAVYSVSGGGNYCAGGAGVAVGLTGSQSGTGYQLYLGTAPAGSSVTGTGAALSFGAETAAGVYKVAATTTAGCGSPMADSAVITIIPTVTPSVSVTVTPGDTICAGTSATFTATSVNGGTTPIYQWEVNTTTTTTGTSYTYTPVNGDMVTVLLTSDATCAMPDTISKTIAMAVDPELIPVVTIHANPGTAILTGQNDTLSVTWTGAGTSPTYQWYVNGIAVPGATSATYTSNNLSAGDSVSCAVIPQGPCGQAGANGVKITAYDNEEVAPPLPIAIGISGGRVTVFPNPVKGQLTVSNGANADLYIYDVMGREVFGSFISSDKVVVDISNLINGVYVVEIIDRSTLLGAAPSATLRIKLVVE